jgi:hypothetical protein
MPRLKISSTSNEIQVMFQGVKVASFQSLSPVHTFLDKILRKNPKMVITSSNYSLGPNIFKTGSEYALRDSEGLIVASGSSSRELLASHFGKFASFKASPSQILDKIAHTFECDYKELGLTKNAALNFAYQCDQISDLLDRNKKGKRNA